MKTKYLLTLTLCFLTLTSTLNTFADDFTQLHLPEGAKARLGKGRINENAYSPDGTRLAVASSIGVWIYDAQTGEALDLLAGENTRSVRSVAFQSRWTDTRKWELGRNHSFMGHRNSKTKTHTNRAYIFDP